MYIKLTGGGNIKHNAFCGEIAELLQTDKSPNLSIAMAHDIKPTVPHYHMQATEVYLMINGAITMKFYDPETGKTWEDDFKSNELCVIGPGIHHQIIKATEQNQLCIICTPRWRPDDEFEAT